MSRKEIIVEKDQEIYDGEKTGRVIFRAFFADKYPDIKGSPLGRGTSESSAIWDLCRRTNMESRTELSKNDLNAIIFRDFSN